MGATILIVDDNPRLRALIRKLLAQEPDLHVVGEAADGAGAIRLAHELRPDIIMMELIMPRVNGLEATQWIKVNYPTTKVIIMTVHTEEAYLRAAEDSGTDAFLIKKKSYDRPAADHSAHPALHVTAGHVLRGYPVWSVAVELRPYIQRRLPMPIQILLAEDHVLVRQGLRALLEQAGMTVISEAADGQEALQMAHEHHPDVAVLDIGMPHLNGLETARRLRDTLPQTKIILLTMHTEDPYVLEAMQAGAVGYVLKTQAARDLVQAIRDVLQGEVYLSPQVSRTVVTAYLTRSDLPPDPLTSREREVLQLIAEGETTKEIAWRLGLSTKTVESHRVKLMRKLDIHETATLVRYAIRRGLTLP